MDNFIDLAVNLTRYLIPAISILILIRCIVSLLSSRYEPEIWAYFETPSGETCAVRHWESTIGSGKSCDIVLDRDNIAKSACALIRNHRGEWKVYALDGGSHIRIGKETDAGKGLLIEDGSLLHVYDEKLTFHIMNDNQLKTADEKRSTPGMHVHPGFTLLLLTVMQMAMALQYAVNGNQEYLHTNLLGFSCVCLIGWCCFAFMKAFGKSGFEVETLALMLTSFSVCVVATCSPGEMLKQMILIIISVAAFLILGWWMRDLGRSKFMRPVAALLAMGLLAANIILGSTVNGASNWISMGGFSFQPSEFIKIAFVYVGAASLDKLFHKKNIFGFILFSAFCVVCLALMGDFGTALIFFATFLVISFMRSGSFATVTLAVSAAAIACFLVISIKPYIATRFASWGHIWEDPYGAGWQQTRALSAAASGGLFGCGGAKGWLSTIFAADTDVVFCLLCEEFGLLSAVSCVIAIVVICFFAVKNGTGGRSSFYVIAACAAASMMSVQLALNVFGCTDLLPFTGVTFPFVSRGGSSMISCWCLLSFIKSSDTRRGASFSVRRPAKV